MKLAILSSNSSAMIAEKLTHTAVNFVVLAVLARNLGTENFGVLNLVQAVFFIGLHLAIFCSEQVMVKLTLTDESSSESLYRRAFILKYVAAIPVYLASIVLSKLYLDIEFAKIVAIYCTIHLTNIDLLFFSLFRARQNGKIVLLARSSVVIPFAALKIGVAIYSGQLLHIAATYALESAVLGSVAFILFRKERSSHTIKKTKNPKPNDSPSGINTAVQQSNDSGGMENIAAYKRLISTSWPIFSSAFLITLYARVDQFMIQSILGNVELGIYSTAVKLSEASTYVMTALIASRFPILVKLHSGERHHYHKELNRLFATTLVFSVMMITFVFFTAELLLGLVFGADYIGAAKSLTIHITGTLFIYYGVICTQYLIAEGLQIFRLYRVLFGLILNVILNTILIPNFGITGAAVATLISQALSSVFFNAFSSKTKEIFYLQITSVAFWRWKSLL